jgi:hypothetical protein
MYWKGVPKTVVSKINESGQWKTIATKAQRQKVAQRKSFVVLSVLVT